MFRSSSLPAFRNPSSSSSRLYFFPLEVSLTQACVPYHLFVSKITLCHCIRGNVGGGSWLCATIFIVKLIYGTWDRPKIRGMEMTKSSIIFNWKHDAKSITELQDRVWPGYVCRTVSTGPGSPSSSPSFSPLSLRLVNTHEHTSAETFSLFREKQRHFKSLYSFQWDPRSENKHMSRFADESHLKEGTTWM